MVSDPQKGQRFKVRSAGFGDETGIVVEAETLLFIPSEAPDGAVCPKTSQGPSCLVRIETGKRQGSTVPVLLRDLSAI